MVTALIFFCHFFGCIKRSYNQPTVPQTIQAPGKDRIAFSYVGFGWCYYVEDKSYKPEVVKTGLEDVVVDVNLDTGIERRDKYEIVFSRRKFLKAHTWPIEFDVIDEWHKRSMPLYPKGDQEYQVFDKLSSEMNGMRSAIDMRRFEKGLCESINKGEASKLKRIPSLEDKARMTEYALRCDKDTGEIIRRTDYELLDIDLYVRLRKVLEELTNHPDWKKYQRVGSPCRENILQFEVSRGKYLGSEVKKLW
jgi:hypothetical protein